MLLFLVFFRFYLISFLRSHGKCTSHAHHAHSAHALHIGTLHYFINLIITSRAIMCLSPVSLLSDVSRRWFFLTFLAALAAQVPFANPNKSIRGIRCFLHAFFSLNFKMASRKLNKHSDGLIFVVYTVMIDVSVQAKPFNMNTS